MGSGTVWDHEDRLLSALVPAIRNRRVALVGNARSLLGQPHGREIDSCDLVIRLNTAPDQEPGSHGTRTDWLAVSTIVPRQRICSLAPRRMFWMSPRRRLQALAVHGWRMPVSFFPHSWWKDLAARLGSRPSTGLMTIDMLVRAGGYSRVVLFGFDFFQSPSLSPRGLAAPPPHDFRREEDHVRRLITARAGIHLVAGSTA